MKENSKEGPFCGDCKFFLQFADRNSVCGHEGRLYDAPATEHYKGNCGKESKHFEQRGNK
jgi:hypothetical protein